MAEFVLADCTAWVHGYDISGDSNSLRLACSAELADSTVFGLGWRRRKPGLLDTEAEIGGFWDTGPDAATFDDLPNGDRVATMSPTGSTADSVAYLFRGARAEYSQFGEIGEMCPFTLSLQGSSKEGLVRGQVAAANGTVSATGALGSAVNLGAGAAGKFAYAALHVFTAGTTITVQVQSDNAEAFSSPTTVGTIGPVTAVGGAWMTRVDASAITDTWFRFNVSAITGSFDVAGAIAIQ